MAKTRIIKGEISKYHNSIDTLSIYAFDKLQHINELTPDDLKLLIIGDNEATSDELISAWETIYNEYLTVISKRKRVHLNHEKRAVIMALQVKYDIVQQACFILQIMHNDQMISLLEENGYKINSSNDLFEEVKKVRKKSKGILTTIKDKEWEIETTQKKGDSLTLDQEIAIIEKHYNNSLSIDKHTMTVSKWLAKEDDFLNDIQHKKTA